MHIIMKKIFSFFIITILFLKVNAQCFSNSLFTGLGIPGVFPPSIAIPGLPIFGINDGTEGSYYSETLTLVVLEDTILDVSSFLPASVIAAMNVAGISTVMTLNVNYAAYSVSGLPNGLSYNCNQTNCEYISGFDGCILIDGIPSQSGNFNVFIDMILNLEIPVIPNPIPGGSPIFGGMNIDLPSFTIQEYDLFISGNTLVNDNDFLFNLFPNPTSDKITIYLDNISDIIVYNSMGKKLLEFQDFNGSFVLNKEQIGCGLFFLNIISNRQKKRLKFIVK